MTDRLTKICERALEHYVAGLHKNQGRTPVPWFHGGVAFTTADIPHLTQQIRAALDCELQFVEQGWGVVLPLALEDCAATMFYGGGPGFLLAHYSYSQWCREYDFLRHPSLDVYSSGVMARTDAPDYLRNDPALLAAFPPKALAGLDDDFCWCPLPHRAGKHVSA
jgi:hypothetical protein